MKITERELAELIGQRDDDHPLPEKLAGLLEPEMDSTEREALMLHLERCASCASAVAVTLDEEATRPRSRSPSFWLAVAAGFATLAIALTVILQVPGDPELHVMRNPGMEIQPQHRISLDTAPTQFQWTSVTQVSGQPLRVRLMDPAARTLWTSPPVTAGNVSVPPSKLAVPGTYIWQLESNDGTVVAGPFWFELQ